MAYYPPSNFITLTLDTSAHPTGLGTGDTAITVNEAISSLETTGYLTLDRASAGSREIVKWTSYNAGTKTFTVTRGVDGTTAKTHNTSVTIAITGNAAYFNDLKTYVSDSLAATPVGIGSVTPSTGAFTTLSATGLVTGGAGTSFDANGTSIGYLASPAISSGAVYSGFAAEPVITAAGLAAFGFTLAGTFDGSGGTMFGLNCSPNVASGKTLGGLYGMVLSASNTGTVTNLYGLYFQTPVATVSNSYLLLTDYGSGGILSGVTTHDTESDEIKVSINGTTKYIKLYVT